MYTSEQLFQIQNAVKYLCAAMKGAEDRNKPELLHSLHVGFRLMDYEYPVNIVVAGFLHDVLEEGEGADLQSTFGDKVFGLVQANSKDATLSNWQAQYTELFIRVGAYGEEALIVKAADVLDNFLYRTDPIGREKTTFLAQELFKYTNANDGIVGELRRAFDSRQ